MAKAKEKITEYVMHTTYDGIPANTVGVVNEEGVVFTHENKSISISLKYLVNFPVTIKEK